MGKDVIACLASPFAVPSLVYLAAAYMGIILGVIARIRNAASSLNLSLQNQIVLVQYNYIFITQLANSKYPLILREVVRKGWCVGIRKGMGRIRME